MLEYLKEEGVSPGLLKDLEAYRAQPEETLADKCRACGACLSKCPQHIKIPEKMAAIRETVDKLSAK